LLINAPGASPTSPYIQSLLVNGKPSTAQWLDPSIITSGGTLDFTMGPTANMSWGTAASDAPPSYGMESTSVIGFGPPAPVVVAPGATVSLKVGAQSARTDVSQTVSFNVAESGFTIAPATGTLIVAAGASASQALSMTVPTTQGAYAIPFSLTISGGTVAPSAAIAVVVAPAGSFYPYFNNAGISTDGTGSQNFDGAGFSLSSAALAAAGATPGASISAAGMTFKWPNTSVGENDNMEAGGQSVTSFTKNSGVTTLGVLGTATNADSSGAQANVTVTYADGTTQTVPIIFTDWTRGGGGDSVVGGTVAITMAYRNQGSSKNSTTTYIYAATAALTSTQPVTSVTFPTDTTGGTIHVFDVELN
jgi:hypothetical protein